MSDFRAISVTEELPFPVEQVWDALTNSSRLSQWLMSTDFRAEIGAEFTLDTGGFGVTNCTVTALEPRHLLAYTWVNGALDTVCTWTVEPTARGTRVILEHSGFDLEHPIGAKAFEGMGAGWPHIVGTKLPAHLASDGA